ncbi:MAG: chloride channel protein [Gammaproteobacteria bacterium]|nr:chloride channel protein [Gammaproteobacteria bacterium]
MDKLLFRIALLGVVTGLMAGILVILFRFSIETSQHYFLPDGQVGNYEALPGWARFSLPVLGAIVLGLFYERLPARSRSVGVVHVLNYMRFRKQKLPFANAVVQFFGGLIAIISGHSVDREGPGIHLGAANVTLIGRHINLTEDDYYLLAAAGAAAAIAAAYNTPLAGVIFVIEVFRVRYALNHIVPVIIASAVATVLSRLMYGHNPAFEIPAISIGSLSELTVIMLMGALIGILAAAFIYLLSRTAQFTISWRPLYAFVVAGVVTGLLAQWSPEIMGVSYDVVDRMFQSSPGVYALFVLLAAKFIATAVSVGVRLPGGLIGPSLILGGAVGGLTEILVQNWFPVYEGSAGFYAMIGMVAMMGAILRAPLTALIALMELTGNLNIILPGMIAVITAEIATRSLIGDMSAFTALLKTQHEREAAQVAVTAQLAEEKAQEEAQAEKQAGNDK